MGCDNGCNTNGRCHSNVEDRPSAAARGGHINTGDDGSAAPVDVDPATVGTAQPDTPAGDAAAPVTTDGTVAP